jgi:hypothetical protein
MRLGARPLRAWNEAMYSATVWVKGTGSI